MPKPTPTTEHSEADAKAELTQFFVNRSVTALEQSIAYLRDCDFYKSVQTKLKAGFDLTADLPELNIKDMKVEVPAIIKKLHEESVAAAMNCWNLKGGAAKVFNTTIRSHDSDDSNLLCFDVEYSANTDDGIAKVNVKTWRRNVSITVTGSDKAALLTGKRLLIAGLGS